MPLSACMMSATIIAPSTATLPSLAGKPVKPGSLPGSRYRACG